MELGASMAWDCVLCNFLLGNLFGKKDGRDPISSRQRRADYHGRSPGRCRHPVTPSSLMLNRSSTDGHPVIAQLPCRADVRFCAAHACHGPKNTVRWFCCGPLDGKKIVIQQDTQRKAVQGVRERRRIRPWRRNPKTWWGWHGGKYDPC